ncbi:hypothetical protein Taro_018554, partial [Colocasia esculenta]|nr:hypothetical protein [Colocasia esculenta]
MAIQMDIVIIGVSVGVTVGIIIASCAFIAIRLYRKRHHNQYRVDELSTSSSLPMQRNGIDASIDSTASISISEASHSLPPIPTRNIHWPKRVNHDKDILASASGILRYSYKDIQKATHNFTTILGQGSFGPVYKATLPTGGMVAVKVLASNSRQGEKEFQTEVSLLSRLHHRNLVNLVGYCVEKGQYMLIYEFMSNGSLASLLYGEGPRILSWEERLQIALDISHGIEYLHEGGNPPVIHRDLKSANILLDRSMRAKVADFGLSKEEVFDGRKSGLKGTYGYMDPDYVSTSKFTKKSDIYSFGIIIFELLTVINPQQGLTEYINLVSYFHPGILLIYEHGTSRAGCISLANLCEFCIGLFAAVTGGDGKADWDEILDKELVGKCNLKEVKHLADVAYKCLHKSPRKRPSISEVTLTIARIKQQHLTKENSMFSLGDDTSGVLERIEVQQIELSRKAGRIDYPSRDRSDITGAARGGSWATSQEVPSTLEEEADCRLKAPMSSGR